MQQNNPIIVDPEDYEQELNFTLLNGDEIAIDDDDDDDAYNDLGVLADGPYNALVEISDDDEDVDIDVDDLEESLFGTLATAHASAATLLAGNNNNNILLQESTTVRFPCCSLTQTRLRVVLLFMLGFAVFFLLMWFALAFFPW
jgi:hypothetical protein